MLPTPSTTHLRAHLNTTIYEPAEDTYLLLDTLSSAAETAFLSARLRPRHHSRFRGRAYAERHSGEGGGHVCARCLSSQVSVGVGAPLILEVGTGSGMVIAFLLANAGRIFGNHEPGHHDSDGDNGGSTSTAVLGLASDINPVACANVHETVRQAIHDACEAREAVSISTDAHSDDRTTEKASTRSSGHADVQSIFLGALQADLTGVMRDGSVDVLVFNPPYVPTENVPELQLPTPPQQQTTVPPSTSSASTSASQTRFETESHLLSLSYAGGHDGMEVTDRFLDHVPRVLSGRGVCYVVLCARNGIEEVKERVRGWGGGCGGGGGGGGRGEKDVGVDEGVEREGGEHTCACPWRWRAETVGKTGGKGGWERLEVVRIWRDFESGVTQSDYGSDLLFKSHLTFP